MRLENSLCVYKREEIAKREFLLSPLLQGPADNPKVNAIVVLKGPFHQTGMCVWAEHPALPDNPVNTDTILFPPLLLSFLSLSLSAEIPALPPPQQDPSPVDQDPDMDEWREPSTPNKFKKMSGPRTQSPYSSDESWFMPITIAIAVFLPILFCMCRVR